MFTQLCRKIATWLVFATLSDLCNSEINSSGRTIRVYQANTSSMITLQSLLIKCCSVSGPAHNTLQCMERIVNVAMNYNSILSGYPLRIKSSVCVCYVFGIYDYTINYY